MEMGWLWDNKEEKNRHTAGEGDVVARVAAVVPEKGVLRPPPSMIGILSFRSIGGGGLSTSRRAFGPRLGNVSCRDWSGFTGSPATFAYFLRES
jgi:hypothetical protein